MTQRPRFFLTGTDTDVGKTTVAAALLQRAQEQGHASLGLKPVASGAVRDAGGVLHSSDAQQLMAASSVSLPVEQVCPFLFEAPLSPHLAAALEGRQVQAGRVAGLLRGSLSVAGAHARVLVEGAGGWRVPINDRETLADVARLLQLPVLLVVGLRLGCINHALLTAEAIRRDGLALAGFYVVQREQQVLAAPEQIATLWQLLGAPCLGVLPWLAVPKASAFKDRVRWPDEIDPAQCPFWVEN